MIRTMTTPMFIEVLPREHKTIADEIIESLTLPQLTQWDFSR